MNIQRRIARISITAGAFVAIVFFYFSIGAILLTGGDGTAPQVTHLAIWLISIPASLFGASQKSALILASLFWGVCVAIVIYFILQLGQRLR